MNRRSFLVPAAVTLALATQSAVSHANGRFPSAQFVVIGPGADDQQILVRNTFGLLSSNDHGQSFDYFCEVTLGLMEGATFDPPVWIGNDGALLAGTQNGMFRFPDRCGAVRVDSLDVDTVSDIAADPTGKTVFAAIVVQSGALAAQVAMSSDGGQTFTRLGSSMPGLLFHTLDVAPTDVHRLYGTLGPITSGQGARLEFRRSDDGGVTWVPTAASWDGVEDAFVAAVDPTNADVVYVRAILPGTTPAGDAGTGDAGMDTRPSVLLRSSDGGQSFMPIGQTTGPMLGFAISDDGQTLWIGGPTDGLLRADNGGDFVRVNTAPVACLRQHANALYVCETGDTSPTLLGRSVDLGATITPLIAYASIGRAPSCLPSAQLPTCNYEWTRIVRQFGGNLDAGARDASTDVLDANADGGTGPVQSGCHCRVATPGAVDSYGPGLTALLAVSVLVRMRRRR